MKNVIKSVFAVIFSLTLMTAFGQKIGHINSGLLLQEIPEVKQANSEIEALQTQLQKKAQGMIQELQTKYQALQQQEQNGELSPKEIQDEAAKLRQEEAKLQEFQQNMEQQLAEKQQSLLQPILDNVNSKITEVAKAEGYTYIIDISAGSVLYADEANDILDKVKAKLGL